MLVDISKKTLEKIKYELKDIFYETSKYRLDKQYKCPKCKSKTLLFIDRDSIACPVCEFDDFRNEYNYAERLSDDETYKPGKYCCSEVSTLEVIDNGDEKPLVYFRYVENCVYEAIEKNASPEDVNRLDRILNEEKICGICEAWIKRVRNSITI